MKDSIFRISFCIILLILLMIMVPYRLKAGEQLYVGRFSASQSEDRFPEGWEPLKFKKIESYTHYSLVMDNNIPVVQAVSSASASGLIKKVRINPSDYPILQWRWKVTNVYNKGDVAQKAGDDYPARIYITFAYDPDKLGFGERIKFNAAKLIYGEYPPIHAINYIWASKAPVGSIVSNPYIDRAKMIVLKNGENALNTWAVERRNIFNDYIAAFGEKPPLISGIAIMTDSDNTKEAATAFYGDIFFTSDKDVSGIPDSR